MPPKAASPPAACPSHRSSRCWVARLAGTAASSTIPPPRCRSIISALGQKLRQPARDPPSPSARRGLSTTRPMPLHLPAGCPCPPAKRQDRGSLTSARALWTSHPPTPARPALRGKQTAAWRRNSQAAQARAATVAAHFRCFFRVSERCAPTLGLGGAVGMLTTLRLVLAKYALYTPLVGSALCCFSLLS